MSALAADPALAVTVSGSGLAHTAGHTCKDIGDFVEPGSKTGQADFCVELGTYTSSDGITSVVAQVEAYCQVPNGSLFPCTSVSGEAAPYQTGDSSGSESDAGAFECGMRPICAGTTRTFFDPIGNAHASDYYLSYNSCIGNAWAVLWSGASITMPDPSNNQASLSGNLGTPHFKVCMSASGSISFTELS